MDKIKTNNMKTTLQFIFLALLFLPNSSCLNKDPLFDGNCTSDCLIFIGTVRGPKGETISGAEITIKHSEGGLFLPTRRLLGELETDVDGRFDFRFDGTDYKINDGFFTVNAYKAGYLGKKDEGGIPFFNIDSTNFDSPNFLNITLTPESKIDLTLNVSLPYNITDLSYSFRYSTNTYTGNIIHNDSLSVTQSYVHTVGGDQTVLLKYNYKRLDTPLEFEESIYIEGGERKKIELHIE